MADLLRQMYDGLTTETDLKGLITTKTKEGIHLEFKMKKNRSVALLDESDAWQFSRALSGFANSDGGVLLWGIETGAHDQAKKLKPITDIATFLGALKKSILNSTQPVVDGVLLDVVPTTAVGTNGYVKCLIAASDKTPHRAMLADREYYRRTSEGFYRLEHFDLEDMFGRRPHPELEIRLELLPRAEDDPHSDIRFSLRNVGRGIAKHPAFLARLQDVKILATNGHVANATTINNGLPTVTYSEDIGVVHATGIWTVVGGVVVLQPVKGAPLPVDITMYCENMSPRTVQGNLTID